MDNNWNMLSNDHSTSKGSRNDNCHAWEFWDLANTTFLNPTSAVQVEARDLDALFFNQQPDITPHYFHSPDRHLTRLKLGKRPALVTKKGRTSSGAAPPILPRCQVEGCHVALVNAKDYHRRHKVCEIHAKAPRVVVHGIEQRFCQQCSRFHSVSEFDETKRSCRRRLAGHNLRRRKNHQHQSLPPPRPYPGIEEVASRRNALSLLSSSNSWIPSSALHDLIAEKRAINLIADPTRKGSVRYLGDYNRVDGIPGSEQCGGVDLTLDLMPVAPSSEFGWLKFGDDCSMPWKLPFGF